MNGFYSQFKKTLINNSSSGNQNANITLLNIESRNATFYAWDNNEIDPLQHSSWTEINKVKQIVSYITNFYQIYLCELQNTLDIKIINLNYYSS